MKISAFMICEYATVDKSGKAFLAGAGADGLPVRSFPTLTIFYLFWFIEMERGDPPGHHMGHIISDDGNLRHDFPFDLDELSPRTKGTWQIGLQPQGPMKLTFHLSLNDDPVSVAATLKIYQSRS